MDPECGRLRRSDRLRSRKDFQRLSREGTRRSSRNFVLLLAPCREAAAGPASRGASRELSPHPVPIPQPDPKLGITVSRKVGNAVVRNRVKRCIREWFRQRRKTLPAAHELVVIARPGAGALTAREIAAELDGALA